MTDVTRKTLADVLTLMQPNAHGRIVLALELSDRDLILAALRSPSAMPGRELRDTYIDIVEGCIEATHGDETPETRIAAGHAAGHAVDRVLAASALPMRADIEQIINCGYARGWTTADIASEILRECDVPATDGQTQMGKIADIARELRDDYPAVDVTTVVFSRDFAGIGCCVIPQHRVFEIIRTLEGASLWQRARLETDDAVRRVREAALPAQSTDGRWQRMESAPKDGTVIFVAVHTEIYGWVRGTSHWESSRGISGWVSRGISEPPGELGLGNPTHWQPVPAPPISLRDMEPK